jgi:murein DD-endopeptidase MepM/ murein hydrolase activator NlpD
VEAEFMGKLYPAIKGGVGERAFFLFGVDLDAEAGRYPLAVHFSDPLMKPVTVEVEVQEKIFPVEELTLPEGMVTPPEEVLERIARERKAAAEVYRTSAPQAVWRPPFAVPTDGTPSGNFGKRRILNGQPKSPHSGVDYKAARGTEVKAVAKGEIRMAEELYYSGKTILIDHGAGLVSQYFHLDSLNVRRGEMVERGATIGLVGATGRVTGPHLHFGIRLYGMRSDPSLLWELFRP